MLLAVAALTVGFAFLFGVESAWWQALMVAALAAALSLLLFLVFAINRPHQGVMRVETDAFDLGRRLWETPSRPPVAAPPPVATP